jgi:hypothetical protein
MKTQDNSATLSADQDSIAAKAKRKRRRESANGSSSEPPSLSRALLNGLSALKDGDFGVRLPLDWNGVAGQVAGNFNEVVIRNERTARELADLRQAVGNTSVLLNALSSVSLISIYFAPASPTSRIRGAKNYFRDVSR